MFIELPNPFRLLLVLLLKLLFRGDYWRYYMLFIRKSWLYRLRGVRLAPDANIFILRSGGDLGILEHIYIDEDYDRLCRPHRGWIVIDIGAHVGLYALKAARTVGKSGLVVAIEPDPENFRILKWNIRINRLRNVIPLRVAVADFNGYAKLYIDKIGKGGGSIISRVSDEFIEVICLTLDRLLEYLRLRNVDLIKIDVQGAEYMVLKGAKKVLKSKLPKLVIEFHSRDLRQKCTSLLNTFGYKAPEFIEYASGIVLFTHRDKNRE